MSLTPRSLQNPLIRNGSHQRQRQRPALSPDHAKIDGRQLADFLVFAYQFSACVNYYDSHKPQKQTTDSHQTTEPTNNNQTASEQTTAKSKTDEQTTPQPSGSWQPFIERYTPVQIA